MESLMAEMRYILKQLVIECEWCLSIYKFRKFVHNSDKSDYAIYDHRESFCEACLHSIRIDIPNYKENEINV